MAERRPVVMIGGVLQELPSGDTLPGGGTEFADNVFRVTDNGDATKKLGFEVSAVTTATTRTATVPNRNFTFDQIESNVTTASGGVSYGVLHQTSTSTVKISNTLKIDNSSGADYVSIVSNPSSQGSLYVLNNNTGDSYGITVTQTGTSGAAIRAFATGTGANVTGISVENQSDSAGATVLYAIRSKLETTTGLHQHSLFGHFPSNGTPGNGFGDYNSFWLSSSVQSREAARFTWLWETATDASRLGIVRLSVYNVGTLVDGFEVRSTANYSLQAMRIGTPSNYVGLAVSSPTSYTITLPSAAPGTDTYLKYNGSAYVWAAAAGGNETADNLWRVTDNGDATKKFALEVSGVTTATTRTATVPNRDFTLDQIGIGSTTISSGTTERFLFNSAGVVANAAELARNATNGRIEIIGDPANDASLYVEAQSSAYWAIDATSSNANAQTARFTATGTSGQAFSSRTYGTTATAAAFLVQRYGATGTTAVQRHGFFSQNFNGSTPGNGFGAYWTLAIKSSTTDDTEVGLIGWRWQNATHASRVGEVYISANNSTSAVEGLTITPSEVYSKLPLRIGTSTNYVGLAVSSPTSYTITLPSAAPTSNTWLKYNGSAYEWASLPAASGGIAESLIDAKGDLIAGTASDTAGRLAVGTDGDTLRAASGQSTGLQWVPGMNKIWKTADETIASNATNQDDDHLAWTIPATGFYYVRVVFYFTTANATMDFKYEMTSTGTATYQGWRRHVAAGAAAGTDNENNVPLTGLPASTAVTATTTGTGRVEIELLMNCTATGTLRFRWAQSTSDAGNLVGKRGSFMEWSRVA